MVFRVTAIRDLGLSIQRLQKARTEYRAALLWMKDVSEKLQNPDYRNQLFKFREVCVIKYACASNELSVCMSNTLLNSLGGRVGGTQVFCGLGYTRARVGSHACYILLYVSHIIFLRYACIGC